MTREEAIKELESGYPKDDTPTEECVRYEEAIDMAIEALEERPQGKWEYLKEHITEMRDADGESILTQKQTCQFILNLMGVIEKEGEAE